MLGSGRDIGYVGVGGDPNEIDVETLSTCDAPKYVGNDGIVPFPTVAFEKRSQLGFIVAIHNNVAI